MYSVIDEVEWRYISSLLRAQQPDTAVYLSGSDFQRPAYGEIFDAVQAVREEMPDAKYGRVCQAVVERTDLPGHHSYGVLINGSARSTARPAYVRRRCRP